MVEAHLIKSKESRLQQFLSYMTQDFENLACMKMRLYVPGKYLVGTFQDSSPIIQVDYNNVFYRDSKKVLELYEKYLQDGNWLVHQSFDLSESQLEGIIAAFKAKEEANKKNDDAKKRVKSVLDSLSY